MAEAGFTRGPDGFYTSSTEGRFITEAKTDAAADNVAETSILASGWRDAGFDVREATLPAALTQDGEQRSTFASIFTNNTTIGEPTVIGFTTAGIPRSDNRWVGTNRGGWSNPEYDRLAQAFNTTLERNERAQQLAQLARIFTDDVPSISLFFRTQPWAFVAALRGPRLVAPEANMAWSMHEWEFR
jgi:peptide/nickel transport system substrate-binding protein